MKTIVLSAVLLTIIFSTGVFASSDGTLAAFDTVTISFGETSRDIGNKGPIDESGYRYEAFGASWALINTELWPHGGDGCVLFNFFGIPEVKGNMMSFQRLDGQPFVFTSLELRARLEGQRNSVVVAHGFLNGLEAASQTLQSSSETWHVEFTNSSFLNPIDELRLELVETNGAALILDNLVFAPVPEPATIGMLLLGGMIIRSRRRKY